MYLSRRDNIIRQAPIRPPKLDYIDGSSLTQFMALRVLLADESPTIKKVFQLSLQDYGVEVRSVTNGIDVEMAIDDFKPDIIFADILLPKKNGYDVGAEIKANNDYSSIPYILMWSGFMDMDQDKFQASKADDKLEKPFESDELRALVQKYVSKTKDQKLSSFLSFPKLPDLDNEEQTNSQTETSAQPSNIPPVIELESSDSDEFQELSLPPQMDPPPARTDEDKDLVSEDEQTNSSWAKENLKPLELSSDPDIDDEFSLSELMTKNDNDNSDAEDEFTLQPTPPAPKTPPKQVRELDINSVISPQRVEEIIREEAKNIIESIAWKVVPEIATQIIEREIQKRLDERNSKEI